MMKYRRHDIDNLFTYHNGAEIETDGFLYIRESAKALGKQIIKHGNNEDDIERAILKLRECVYYAITSIVVPKVGE